MTEEQDLLPRVKAALAGKYDVTRELGRGGMATVYLATDVKHGREVAIKVLLPELSATLGADRFEREIRLAAKLQHPHILGMFDSGSADGLLYYVMPFVKGESLRDRIDREGMLPIEDALQYALEVNDALGHAHVNGVIHRDIKPENILLTGGHALVADFGIARAVSEGGANAKLTATGMSMGTPYYMAPEQASGETVGPTADIYSLGCVLFEMLSGDPPFTGKNSMQIMAKHAMEQVPSIRIIRSVVPEEIENAIFVAMNKTPADRPQNAEQFAQLLGITSGNTASMRMLTPTMQRRIPSGAQAALAGQRPWWRHPAAAAGIVAIVGAGAAWGIWGRSGSGPSAASLDPNARRVAVLYFEDHSRDSTLGALADGLTEGLIRSLSTAPTLTVITRSGVEPYRHSAVAPDSIARALRAGYLVRGEVEPEGDQVRVSLRLDDASGANIDRTSFLRPATNQIAMRDTLTLIASDLIRRQLREEIQVRAQRENTTSEAAWLLLQRAEQARKNAEDARVGGDQEAFDRGLQQADSLLVHAEQADARWPEPVTLRAAIAYRRSRVTGDLGEIRRWTGVAEEHATRALALNPSDADALEVRGNAKYWAWLKSLETNAARAEALLASAKQDLEQATTANPSQAGAWASLSHLYYQTGTATDISIAAQRALEADEFLSNADVILNRLFLSSYDLGQFDKGDQRCNELQRRFPTNLNSVRCQLYLLTGGNKPADVARAWTLADSAVAMMPPQGRELQRLNVNMLVAGVIARASRDQPTLADSARRVARASEGNASIDASRDLALSGAFVYTLLGDNEAAVRMLKQYLAANPQRAKGLRDEPGWWFRGLETDAAYRQLIGLGR